MLRPLAFSILLAMPATAQQVPAPAQPWVPPPAGATQSPRGQTAEGLDEIQRGAGTIFDDLLRRIEPHMEGIANAFGDTAATVGPVLDDFAALVDDIGNYQKPERLPNGDILIRRRADAPPPPQMGETMQGLTRPSPDVPAPAPVPAPVVPRGPQIDL